MQKVVEFLQKNSVQYLATVGRDGKAKCRPFMFCFEQDGKLWFCTNNTKDVYKDMLANPEVEVSVSSPGKRFVKGVFSLPCLNLSCSNICAYI